MTDQERTERRERLAALAHEQWAEWMRYLFRQTYYLPNEDVQRIIPRWAVERWQRQMRTPYADLSEEEKESDRKEADRMLEVMELNNE